MSTAVTSAYPSTSWDNASESGHSPSSIQERPTEADISTEYFASLHSTSSHQFFANSSLAYTEGINITQGPPPYFDNPELIFHPHWRLYREVIDNIPDAAHYVLGLYIAFVGVIGITGNIVVIYLFAR